MGSIVAYRLVKQASPNPHLHRIAVNGSRILHSTPCRLKQYPRADLDTFNKVIGKKDRVVLVDFYADWCAPCQQLTPVLESLAADPDVKSGSALPLDLVQVNTDDSDGFTLGQQYEIRALPTVIAFRDGKPVNQFVGAVKEDGVRSFLEKV